MEYKRLKSIHKKHLLPRSNERSMESRVRNPLKYKGLRTRLRTMLQAKEFKYRTDIMRGNGPFILITLKKGDVKEFANLLAIKLKGVFEGLPIFVSSLKSTTKD